MPESQPVFDPGQQSKFQQLQLEVTALEEQVENVLKEQLKLTNEYDSYSPIPLIYVDDRFAKSGIKLIHETVYLKSSEFGIQSSPKGLASRREFGVRNSEFGIN